MNYNAAKNPRLLYDITSLHKIPYDILKLACEFGIMTNVEIGSEIVSAITDTGPISSEDLNDMTMYYPLSYTYKSIESGIIKLHDYWESCEIKIHGYMIDELLHVHIRHTRYDTECYTMFIYFDNNECYVYNNYDPDICVLTQHMNSNEIKDTIISLHNDVSEVVINTVIRIAQLWFCYSY